jgi:cytoskeleton protein RodZ
MTSEEQPSPAVQDPAGQQLRRAREALGLSLEQVADAQHLRPSVIQDIEQGRYERIDSELFLKGYVRAYAKQVNLNAESLLATLDHELEPLREQKAREAEANPLVSIERKKRQKRRIAKVLAWIVILGVIIAGVMAYMDAREAGEPEAEQMESTENSATVSGDQPVVDTDEPETGVPPELSVSENEATGSGSAEETAEEAVPEKLNPEGAPQTQVPDEGVTAASEDASADAPVSDDSQQPSAVEPLTEAPSITPEQQPEGVLASGPMEEPVAPPVPLEMSFTGDCWIQIRDANGDQLAAALKRSGDRLEVEGVPPLTVVVGAVDAVSAIRFDNKPVDMKDFRVYNNRTEFTLEL